MKLNGLELTKRERDFLATNDEYVLTNFNVVRHYSDRPNELIRAIEAEGVELASALANDSLYDEQRRNPIGDAPTPHLPDEEEIEKLNRTIFAALDKIARTVFEAAKLKPGKYTLAKLASPKMQQAYVVDCACEEFSPAGIEFDGVNIETILDGTALRVDAGTFKCSFAKTKLFEVLKNFASAHGFTVAQFVKAADDESTLQQLQGAEYVCKISLPFFAKAKKYCQNGISVDVSGQVAANLSCEVGPFLSPCQTTEKGENPTLGVPCVQKENLNSECVFFVKRGVTSDYVLQHVVNGGTAKIRFYQSPVFEFSKTEIKIIQAAAKGGLQECAYRRAEIICHGGTLRVNIPIEIDRDTLKPCKYRHLEFAHDGHFFAEIQNITLAKFKDWDGRVFLHDKGSFLFLSCPFGLVQTGVNSGEDTPTGETVSVADYLQALTTKPAKRPARRRKEAPAAETSDVEASAKAPKRAPRKQKEAAKSDAQATAPAPATEKQANGWDGEQFNKAYDEMKFISMIIRWCVMICAYFIAGETARTQIRLDKLLNLSGRTSTRPKEEKPAKATETAKADAQTTDGVAMGGQTGGPAREPTDTDGKAGTGGFVPPPTTAPDAAPRPNDLREPAIAPPARGGHRRRARPNYLARRTVWPQVRRRAPTTKAPERFAYPNGLHRTKINVCHLPRGSPALRPFIWPYKGFFLSDVQFPNGRNIARNKRPQHCRGESMRTPCMDGGRYIKTNEMKTQIRNIVKGNRFRVGTPMDERFAVAEKVFAENPGRINMQVNGVHVCLTYRTSTTGKTKYYEGEISETDALTILGWKGPRHYKHYERTYSLTLYMDMTMELSLFSRRTAGAEMRNRANITVDSDNTTIE